MSAAPSAEPFTSLSVRLWWRNPSGNPRASKTPASNPLPAALRYFFNFLHGKGDEEN